MLELEDTEDAVYKTLSRVEWKKSIEIIREVEKATGQDASIAKVHLVLERGEHEGWVESQEATRGDLGRKPIKTREYRIKSGGIRKTKDKRGLFGISFPKIA